jgi:2-keto-4-pentenoate hydratase/2-oxohepta-3-ene-1,7-dioic acid hydratase in catechol pathway
VLREDGFQVKLVNVWDGERRQVGVLDGGIIRPLQVESAGPKPDATDEVICRWPDGCPLPGAGSGEIQAQAFLPSVIKPAKVICTGLNYLRHVQGAKHDLLQYPTFFAKFASSLTAHQGKIVPPRGSVQIDYEGELAVVIGREGRNIPEERALEHVFGYTVGNDVTARELQRRTTQWLSGKAPDTFCPLGPYLVTRDEIPDPGRLSIRTWVNGELVQDGNTVDMIFPVPHLVAELSKLVTLQAGDVILTGTPDGTQMERQDPQWLKAGDVVEIEIEGLGRLSNQVAAPL